MRPRLCRYLFDDNLLRLTNASGTRDLIMNRDFKYYFYINFLLPNMLYLSIIRLSDIISKHSYLYCTTLTPCLE